MGGFYTNYTLRTADHDAVVKALKGFKAVVSPVKNGCIVVAEEKSDHQSEAHVEKLASRLSGKLKCPVLAVIVHDDDILLYWLCDQGKLVDRYNSKPGYFDPSKASPPIGGDAQKLCRIFNSDKQERVEQILRESRTDKYVFENERHAALIRALNISKLAHFCSYAGIDYNEEFDDIEFVRTRWTHFAVACNQERDFSAPSYPLYTPSNTESQLAVSA
jgi:hypothetical protein